MTSKEQNALASAGIIFGKINYGSWTKAVLYPPILLKFSLISWPKLPKHEYDFRNGCGIGTNTSIVSYLGYEVGLSFSSDNGNISVGLQHPASDYWLSILQPIWDKKRAEAKKAGICPLCQGSGWDGIGYTLTCVDCGGTGKVRN